MQQSTMSCQRGSYSSVAREASGSRQSWTQALTNFVVINVIMIFVGFPASQQESNRSWISKLCQNRNQRSRTFLSRSGDGVKKIQTRSPRSDSDHLLFRSQSRGVEEFLIFKGANVLIGPAGPV